MNGGRGEMIFTRATMLATRLQNTGFNRSSAETVIYGARQLFERSDP